MNSSVKNLVKNFFNRYYWKQHPETALRYSQVVAEIKKTKYSNILEVGSGSLGIVPYLKKSIDGLDVSFKGPQTKLLSKVKGRADELPFKKNQYDIVISVDTIEHLPKEAREKAINEIIRVAKKLAVIVVPVGEQAQLQDKKLSEHYKKIFNSENSFLEEHVKNGLPTTENILVAIDRSLRENHKKAKIKSQSNLNLFIREILMKTWISKNKFFYALYMKGYLLFVPVLKFANFGNCYRRTFVIEFLPHNHS